MKYRCNRIWGENLIRNGFDVFAYGDAAEQALESEVRKHWPMLYNYGYSAPGLNGGGELP